MNVTTETLENCEVLLTVEMDSKQRNNLLNKAARRISREIKIPGFRPGKAPYKVIVNRFGEEAIQEEAMQDLSEGVFKKAIEQANITPFAPASLDSIEWEPLVMKVKIPTEPIVELANYKDIRLDIKEITVTEEDVMERLEDLREEYAIYTPVERGAELGDLVTATISLKNVATGEMLVEDDEQDFDLTEKEVELGFPDFTSHLIEATTDKEITFTHAYPDDFQSELFAGKEIEFHLKVAEVKIKELEELDDDFVGLVGDYETLDELKQKITEELTAKRKQNADEELMETMLSKVVTEAHTIKWPPVLEEEELDQALKTEDRQQQQRGLDLKTLLQMQHKTEEEFREELREKVKENLKRSLVLAEIAKQENIEIDYKELARHADLMVNLSGGSQEAVNALTSEAGLRFLRTSLISGKTRERLLNIAKGIVDEDVEETEDESSSAEVDPETDTEVEAETGDESIAAENVAETDNDVHEGTSDAADEDNTVIEEVTEETD